MKKHTPYTVPIISGGNVLKVKVTKETKRVTHVKAETHTETIKCPECNAVQAATVKHTEPFYTYIHDCENCKHLIMESDWNKVIEKP